MALMLKECPMWNFGQQIKIVQRSGPNDFIKKISILGEL